ncbi:3-dehydrosphinganine reductase [Recurvomyces mirabilis]|nr:3-dehydrosphinganine reductase [Recurvomyces mirabilis]
MASSGLFYWATALLCVVVAALASDIMGFFSSANHFDVKGGTVMVTGGSQGMGKAVGRLLASKGANVVIVARNQQKLDEALKYISSAAVRPSQRFLAISADVTSAEENIRIINEVTEWNAGSPPDVVWANAGFARPALFIETSIEDLRSQIDINYLAACYLAHATLKSWLRPAKSISVSTAGQSQAARPRHFIMTSSTACFVGVAGYAPYSPAKAALRSLADTLRSEVNLYNGYRRAHLDTGPRADVNIHCVLPGGIQTPGNENENLTKHPVTHLLEEGDPAQTEDRVAAVAVKSLEKGGYLITTQWLGHAMRAGALSGSPRNNRFIDTIFAWAVNVAWLFIGPDMESTVYKYGKTHEIDLPG